MSDHLPSREEAEAWLLAEYGAATMEDDQQWAIEMVDLIMEGKIEIGDTG